VFFVVLATRKLVARTALMRVLHPAPGIDPDLLVGMAGEIPARHIRVREECVRTGLVERLLRGVLGTAVLQWDNVDAMHGEVAFWIVPEMQLNPVNSVRQSSEAEEQDDRTLEHTFRVEQRL
jgi:hypothetical protein